MSSFFSGLWYGVVIPLELLKNSSLHHRNVIVLKGNNKKNIFDHECVL
jgi:hypothetical protein